MTMIISTIIFTDISILSDRAWTSHNLSKTVYSSFVILIRNMVIN